MTANRDELTPLIEGRPENQVEVVLADVRRFTADKPESQWPPAFFGAGVSRVGHTDHANADTYLAAGFGRQRS